EQAGDHDRQQCDVEQRRTQWASQAAFEVLRWLLEDRSPPGARHGFDDNHVTVTTLQAEPHAEKRLAQLPAEQGRVIAGENDAVAVNERELRVAGTGQCRDLTVELRARRYIRLIDERA